MDILITGIHGFVGGCLVEALRSRHRLYGVDIVQPQREGVAHTYTWQQLDRVPPVDAVIHLAAIAHDTRGTVPGDVVMSVNTELTRRIFDYFADRKSIGRFVCFSSCSVFGDRGVMQHSVIDEDTPLSPVTAYGRSKAESERMIHSRMSAEPHLFEGRKVFILRPAMIYGPGAKGNLRLLEAFVRRGLPWPLGAWENRRTFVAAANVQYTVGRLIDDDIAPGTYMLADDDSLSTNELVRLIADAYGRHTRIMRVPRPLVRACVAVGDVLHLPLNSARFDKLTGNCMVSNARLRRALGIDRMPVAVAEALSQTLRQS